MVGPTSLENTAPSLEIKPDANPANIPLLQKIRDGIAKKPELYSRLFEIKVDYAENSIERMNAVNNFLREEAKDADLVPEVRDQWNDFLDRLPGAFTIADDYRFDPATTNEGTNHSPIKNIVEQNEDDLSYSQRKEKDFKERVEWMRFFLGRAVAHYETEVELLVEAKEESNGSAA